MGNVAYYEGQTTIGGLFNTIRDKVMTAYTTGTNNWSIIKDVGGQLILKMKTETNKEAYIEFKRWTGTNEQYYKGTLLVRYSDSIDDVTNELTMASPQAYTMFAGNSGDYGVFKRTDDMYVEYYLSMNNNYIALSIKGDPVFDYTKYFNSFLYFGAIVPFSDNDIDGNIAFTVSYVRGDQYNGGIDDYKYGFSSDADKVYGSFTTRGMDEISMLKTYSKLRYQKHYPALLFNNDVVDNIANLTSGGTKNNFFFSASKWSDKFHASPIYIVHPYEGYRGYLENVISVNPQSLIDRDILQENVGTDLAPVYQTYRLIFLQKNAPYNFLSALKTNKYIVAIRMT